MSAEWLRTRILKQAFNYALSGREDNGYSIIGSDEICIQNFGWKT